MSRTWITLEHLSSLRCHFCGKIYKSPLWMNKHLTKKHKVEMLPIGLPYQLEVLYVENLAEVQRTENSLSSPTDFATMPLETGMQLVSGHTPTNNETYNNNHVSAEDAGNVLDSQESYNLLEIPSSQHDLPSGETKLPLEDQEIRLSQPSSTSLAPLSLPPEQTTDFVHACSKNHPPQEETLTLEPPPDDDVWISELWEALGLTHS